MDGRKLGARTLDAGERLLVAALYAYFVFNILSDFLDRHNAISAVLLASESTILIFTLLRRATDDITRRPLDWALGFAATVLPLLVLPAYAPLIPPAAILMVMLAGAALQITAKLYLRRSFGIVAANRGIMSGGPYRFIRHPIYAGYTVTQLGFLLANPSGWNLALYALCWALQLCRIVAEERLLSGDQSYRELTARVRYRLIPGVF